MVRSCPRDINAFAREWIEGWNSHDLDAILYLCEESVMLISPVAARIWNDPAGVVKGNSALRQSGTRSAEFMEFGANGKAIRIVAHYSL